MKKILAILAAGAGLGLAAGAQPLFQNSLYSVFADRVVEGPYTARAVSATGIESNYAPAEVSPKTRVWRLSADVARYPHLQSGVPLIDALYNMALDEMTKDIRPDGAFMAGAEWEGVWTRDVSYSTLLALAAVEPDAAKISLLKKVKRDRIVQDTGTGGSWPCSTDRMVWALAAWEIFQVTGDRAWLRQSFEIIRNSAADDRQVVFSRATGGVLGESSFLDWRQQTYPRWMNPVDIYESQNLGTNAVHYRAYRILASMARLLGEPADRYDEVASRIRTMMNERLWIENSGYYGQYLYGRTHLALSPRPEALGEALAILFDIATPGRQDRILESTPVTEFGIPCIYPETPGLPPYHNNAVWPFVQTFWNLAAAKRHDSPALLGGWAAMARASALFLTDKENMVASTGSYAGTVINSDRQLWSVAGSLAMVYRVLFGMEFTPEGIRLAPVVPEELRGVKTLENFRYRKAVLSLRIEGYGANIESLMMDGRPLDGPIPADLAGNHEIRLRLASSGLATRRVNLVQSVFAPDTPVVSTKAGTLEWKPVPGALEYRIYSNAERVAATKETSFVIADTVRFAEYQVSAVDGKGLESFLSEPVPVGGKELAVEAEDFAPRSRQSLTGFSGSGFVELDRTLNPSVTVRARVPENGYYQIAFRYSNGSGPVNTDNKCAIRTLIVDGVQAGAIVLPQRGIEEWSNWGTSSVQRVRLKKGMHTFELRFEPSNENMNSDVNRAMLDNLRLVRVD